MEQKKNNQLTNLLVNIIIPVIILTKFSKEEYLGPLYGLLAALAPPFLYGLYDLIKEKRKNFFSILGFVGVLLSGMIGLLKFPPQWVAVKEASIPLLIGIIVIISTRTPWQLVKKFIYNRELLDIDQIEARLEANGLRQRLEVVLQRANLFLAGSFFISAVLNFVLAKIIVHSMPGTSAFNEEIGRMTMLSFPVIALPSTLIMMVILWYLMRSLRSITQMNLNELFSEKFRDK